MITSEFAIGELTIRVGAHQLYPNTAAQVIQILVEGDEVISGVDLFAQVADGGPGLSSFGLPPGNLAPLITNVSFGGATIFAGARDVPINLGSDQLPQTAVHTLALLGPVREVSANGVLLDMTIDTTGQFEGHWPLSLSNVLPFSVFGGPHHTNFANSGTPNIENGSISIVTETCDLNDDPSCSPLGDFNGDNEITAADVDSLSAAIRAETDNLFFDITSDGSVDESDRDVWVHDVTRTYFGDANLDRLFDSGDFVQVFKTGLYEDAIPQNANWASGDWDGDGDFTSGDFVLAFKDDGYEKGPKPAFVPEPLPSDYISFLSLSLASSLLPGKANVSSELERNLLSDLLS